MIIAVVIITIIIFIVVLVILYSGSLHTGNSEHGATITKSYVAGGACW